MNKRKLPLDKLDIKILAALQCDGRISKVELADKIGLSPSACWTRLKRLEDEGFIRAYKVDIDLGKIAQTTEFWTQITLSNHRFVDFEKFEQVVKTTDSVTECWAIGGGADYLLKFVVTGIEQYQHIIDSLLMAEIGIDRYYTYIVTKAIKRVEAPPIGSFIEST